MNNFFTNKIGAFYPIDANGNRVAYINFQSLPAPAQVTFNISVMAYDPKAPYQFHLLIYKDNYNKDSKTVDMYVTTNPATIKINESNAIESNLNSTNFSLTTDAFNVDSGVHTYEARIELLDIQGNKLDDSKSWFLTRLRHPMLPKIKKGGIVS